MMAVLSERLEQLRRLYCKQPRIKPGKKLRLEVKLRLGTP